MNYIEHQFEEIEKLTDKHEKTLNERSLRKEFHSELHRLLDTKYIVHHLEFVEFKGSTDYKRMSEKTQDFQASMWREIPDRCKKELDNYEENRSIHEDTHKALDGLYNSGKLSFGYAFILKCNLTVDWKDASNLENARQAYKDRKKYK
ncbi:hypothetical protein F4X73_02565 [Candidatus Poribacteria bacterium]|nr:hypothetical protein [Candidatus Poribacteria bacterium]MYF56328.1 hypothetical protein [Candidatus Poribacteria bacterium]